MADREEAVIQIYGTSETYNETNQEIQEEITEIQEAADQIDDQLETSTETNQELPGEPLGTRHVTIFRLPNNIHENSKELCKPNLVSIGPYHHRKEGLRTMEEHKWYMCRKFLASKKKVGLEDALQAMQSIEAKARNCYSENVDLGSADFAQMLLLDGCFILEWFKDQHSDKSDVIFNSGWAKAFLLSDMFLLENQIPLFVLHKLFTIHDQGGTESPTCQDHCPLLELICRVLGEAFSFTKFSCPQKSCHKIYHLLHLCYLGIVPASKSQTQFEQKNSDVNLLQKFCHLGSFLQSKLYLKSSKAPSSEESDSAPAEWTFPSISELNDAGVKFKRKNNPTSILDVAFTNGTIEMPFLQIQVPTMRILWNMVAFEQSRYASKLPQIISSYFALMDTLINTGKDVTILEQSRIFENLFHNAEDAATFFNQFDKIFFLYYKDHHFKGLFQDVRKYSQSMWHRYRARLMQDYFSNPWAIISVGAAASLLILTGLQTYYSAT